MWPLVGQPYSRTGPTPKGDRAAHIGLGENKEKLIKLHLWEGECMEDRYGRIMEEGSEYDKNILNCQRIPKNIMLKET